MNHARDPLYRRHRFPAEVIGYAVWLYFRFPLSLRMVEEMVAARGIIVSHETIRCWAEKFGREFSKRIAAARRFVAINGISMRLSSQSPARSIGSGAPSIRTASFSISSFKAEEIEPPRSGLCGSC